MKKIYFLVISLLVLSTFLPGNSLQSQSNQYLHFDRVDDYVVLNNASQYFSGTTQLSIAGWFYCDQLAYGQGYMGFRIGSGNAEFYLIQLNNGVLECRLKTTTGLHEYVSPANTVIPQVWQHIAWVFDVSSVKLYVNGTLKGSGSASGIFQGENVPFAIGKSLLGGFNFVYGGRVDEISAWNKALTAADIQAMMADELTGTEENLQLYYKFNQGVPGGDNTSITHLSSEVGGDDRDAELLNFALNGETSNFNGTLNTSYQAISFPQIDDRLVSHPPFTIEATATSGLQVYFEVLSGPATIDGNLVTLTGQEGEVVIKATQPGNSQFDPAVPVINSFMVLDPATYVPEINIRNPLSGNVYMPVLQPIQLSAVSTIGFPNLFSVSGLRFEAGNQIIYANDLYANSHYTAWWTPPSYGTHIINVVSTNNFGASAIESVTVNITSNTQDINMVAAEGVWLSPSNFTQTVEAELPSYVGAFDQITATLTVSCPAGGCGEWDRVASVDAMGIEGRWFEIIRYITPYGVPCQHVIDLTDYMSILQGKVKFRFNCMTLDNGFVYKLTLNYNQGSPSHPYSSVYEIWKEIYPFGDYANLQPVEEVNFEFPDNAVASTLKLVSTGHGWGNLNTGNAAEFYNATHHIWVNGAQTFDQLNWKTCNPNPDGCQPQNGTWFYNRAGWCPGSIAPWFDFNMSPYVNNNVTLGYKFAENYIDLCHPNHPDCVTGVTCTDCNDGFNPTLDVAANLVVFSANPIVGLDKNYRWADVSVTPNPTTGILNLKYSGYEPFKGAQVQLFDLKGNAVWQMRWTGGDKQTDLSHLPKGIYVITIESGKKKDVRKVVLQ